MNYTNVIAAVIDVVFPAGVAIGASSSGNFLKIDRNGENKPVIRGTSLAGILRHAYSEYFSEAESNNLFGSISKQTGEAKESKIVFSDSVLEINTDNSTVKRTHISVDRHWSNVSDGALFSFSATPPNTKSKLLLQIFNENEIFIFEELQRIASLFASNLILGGNSNRGVGLIKLENAINYKHYVLNDINEFSLFIDDKRAWKQSDFTSFKQSKEIKGKNLSENLVIDVPFSIPNGQDLLIGNMDGIMQPCEVLAADGKRYWQLPGSSVRGVIKSYITNLAAKEGKLVSDTFENSNNVAAKEVSDQKGWLFKQPAEGSKRNPILHKKYLVASLFGSLHATGRIHITDSFVPFSENDAQTRAHVAIDSITGGAIEGMLFYNKVLILETNTNSKFTTSVIIKNPQKHEIKWLIQALKAIDSGFLRLGSSKASGRLEIQEIPQASGKYETKFSKIWKEMS